MYFVDDDELSGLCAQIGVGIIQSAQISRTLEIEIERRITPLLRNLARQRGLADLARPQEHDRRRLLQPLTHDGRDGSRDQLHAGNHT